MLPFECYNLRSGQALSEAKDLLSSTSLPDAPIRAGSTKDLPRFDDQGRFFVALLLRMTSPQRGDDGDPGKAWRWFLPARLGAVMLAALFVR